MSVLLRIGKNKAILRGGEWRSASVPLEEALNGFTRRWVQREAQSAELQGDLEHRIAAAAAQRFQGRIGLQLDSEVRLNQRQYLNLRQLHLFDSLDS
ncbi:MAG: hypothetical protein IT170_08955 [Bryobacterales bacterium]|nr:hypothetical protein [Bryobacterales bacterium]